MLIRRAENQPEPAATWRPRTGQYDDYLSYVNAERIDEPEASMQMRLFDWLRDVNDSGGTFLASDLHTMQTVVAIFNARERSNPHRLVDWHTTGRYNEATLDGLHVYVNEITTTMTASPQEPALAPHEVTAAAAAGPYFLFHPAEALQAATAEPAAADQFTADRLRQDAEYAAAEAIDLAAQQEPEQEQEPEPEPTAEQIRAATAQAAQQRLCEPEPEEEPEPQVD